MALGNGEQTRTLYVLLGSGFGAEIMLVVWLARRTRVRETDAYRENSIGPAPNKHEPYICKR